MLSVCYQFFGDHAAAQFYCERAMARAAEPGTSIPNFFGFDHRTYPPTCLARTLWMRGFADQACSIAKAGIDELLSGDNPFSICITLTYGLPVFLWSGELQSAENYTNRLMEYAGRYSLEVYRAVGLGLKGAIAIARDELETGIDLLRGALETLTTQRMNILLTEFMGPLAEGLRKRGQPEEALSYNQSSHRARNRSRFDI